MKTTPIALTLGAAFLFTSALVPNDAPVDPRVPALTIPPPGAAGGPVAGLTEVETRQFARGFAVFDRAFHQTTGLGAPEYNADSCRACHQDPVIGGAGGLELNVSRIGFDNGGIGPFQDIPGGQMLSKFRGPWLPQREEYDALVADVFEQRQTPSALGLGLVDTIFEASIVANADPFDLDGDGISGAARYIDVGGVPELGRFGWKCQIPQLADFVSDAMAGECGITTPDNGRGFALLADPDVVPDPELSQQDFDDIAFFLENLAAPQRTFSTDPDVLWGEQLFDMVGCTKCHVPSLPGTKGDVFAYSDFLLHFVVPPTFRGMGDPNAGVGEFRTPPLWGISDTAPYMHDGAASDLDLAIRAHFSEGEASRLAYEALIPADQQALIDFLNDL